ncbi:MAG: RdgB/HAM1 family non-canonical purine NTP pyrophosphatase [Muribaculaceae bacterium]|nr:RdgB/HAM1 family non-canonical purine NTP pyrophosphatase [Muribaculaceae bacterium]
MKAQIVLASNNAHKLAELRSMLPGVEVLGLADIGCHDDIPETADTFAGNALLKARWVKERYGYDCIADDSGLEVDALAGAPGVYSARFAGKAHDDATNNALLLQRLDGVTDRRARFRTVIALVQGADEPRYFEGTVEGTILTAPRGTDGFGYDPLFMPCGWTRSFAEATREEKNAVSHRGNAVRALCTFLVGRE